MSRSRRLQINLNGYRNWKANEFFPPDDVEQRFEDWKADKANSKLLLYHPEEKRFLALPYLHRWHSQYRFKVGQRMDKLQEWIRDEFVHLNLNVDTKRMTPEEAMVAISDGWHRLHAWLKKRKGGKFEYLWVVEPTKKGYAHLHVLLLKSRISDFRNPDNSPFHYVVEERADKYTGTLKTWKHCPEIDRQWDSYGFGWSNWAEPCTKDSREVPRVAGYVVKYLKKQSNHRLFAAWLWWYGKRSWGMSQGATKASKSPKPPPEWDYVGSFSLDAIDLILWTDMETGRSAVSLARDILEARYARVHWELAT